MSEYPAAPPVSLSASAPAPPPPPPWWALIYWSVVGALTGLGLMAILTIGGYLLTAAMGMGLAVLAVPPLRSRAWPMAIAGIAAGPWFVAWLNRSGPGTVCWHTATEVHCTDEWSPWPFAAAGALLVAVGIGVYRAVRR